MSIDQRSPQTEQRGRPAGSDSRASIYTALAANGVIAAAKLVAGLLTASPALMSEAAHSVADSLNELFLLASLRRSGRAADRRHQFGYGKERFFWSFLAAVGIFVTGGCFSLYQGVRAWQSPQHETGTDLIIAAVVLVIALAAESASLAKALSQARERALGGRERGHGHERDQDREGRRVRGMSRGDLAADPALRTVIAEDGTAVLGVFVALVGIGLHALTGQPRFEAGASWVIGVLLLIVAFRLGMEAQRELIGQSVDPQLQERLTGFLAQQPEIDTVIEVLTMRLGPDSTLLAARIDLQPGMDSETVEDVCGRIKRALHERWPSCDHIFLDITDLDGAD